MPKCNLVLNTLNIVLWKLRYPVIFSKNTSIRLLINIRLLIVSDILITLDDPFIEDVIRVFHFNLKEVYVITADKVDTLILSSNSLDYCWLIGVKILYNFYCITFYTPSLSILKDNSDEKRNLWNQIYRFL